MSIPLDANFKSVSCQLGGLRLNGIVNYSTPGITSGTAQSLSVITIDDPDTVQTTSRTTPKGYLQVKIAGSDYYIQLYQ